MPRNFKNPAPKEGSKTFNMNVIPSKEALEKAIADNGMCKPSKCWHKVAIFAILIAWFPDARANDVKVDAGHIRLNYRGWRYIADTPKHVKRSLMLFDKEFYERLSIRAYILKFRRTTKIVPITAKQRAENAAEYRRRRNQGWVPPRPPEGTSLRKRVEGFSSIV